jgi:hypothetical protein
VRGVDLPTLKTVRAKWALTTAQAGALLAQLPPLARTMVGLAILSGGRRGRAAIAVADRCRGACKSVRLLGMSSTRWAIASAPGSLAATCRKKDRMAVSRAFRVCGPFPQEERG